MNLRPSGYEPDELPNCSTPRYKAEKFFRKWMEKDSNLRSRRQQIYSLPPLATRESIHMQADDRTRTDNLLITNQLLCQLSHIGLVSSPSFGENGAYRARTCDPLLVRQMLSQLS